MPRQSHRIQPVQWHDPHTDLLVDERRRRNDEYHNTYGRSRQEFWESVARRFIYIIFKNRIFNSTNPFI